MATCFHLIRHATYALAETALGGRAAYALSAAGHRQAAGLADFFVRQPIAAVVTSPVRRAQETAEVIARNLQRAAQSDEAFAEIDFAGWTGSPFEALRNDPAWQAWNGFRSTAGVPGGDTMLAVQARAVAGIVRLAVRHPDSDVIVVSHADVIRAVLAHFLGMPLDMIRRLRIAPASVSRVALHAGDAEILDVNRLPTDRP